MRVFLKALVGDYVVYRDGSIGRLTEIVTNRHSFGYVVTINLWMNTFHHHLLGGTVNPASPVGHKDILILR